MSRQCWWVGRWCRLSTVRPIASATSRVFACSRSLGNAATILAVAAACDGPQPGGVHLHRVPPQGTFVQMQVYELSRLVSGEPFSVLARDMADYLVGLGISG